MKSNDEWNQKLEKNRKQLVDNISLTGLYTCLRSSGVIDQRSESDIKNGKDKYDQKEALLDHLKERPKEDKEKFCQALIDTNQGHIVDQYLKPVSVQESVTVETHRLISKLTDQVLLYVANKLGTEEKIRNLTVKLKIDTSTVDAAFSDNPRSVNMAAQSLLRKWGDSHALRPEEDTVKALRDALIEIGCENIVKKYLLL